MPLSEAAESPASGCLKRVGGFRVLVGGVQVNWMSSWVLSSPCVFLVCSLKLVG